MEKIFKRWGYLITQKIIHIVLSIIVHNSIRIVFLRLIGVKIGKNCFIHRSLKMDFWWRLQIENNCFINKNVYLDCRGGKILIQHSCDISDNSIIYTLSHDIYSKEFKPKEGDVFINERVWICTRTIILPQTKIGKGSVIGAYSVVQGDIPEFSLYSQNTILKKLPKDRAINVRKSNSH